MDSSASAATLASSAAVVATSAAIMPDPSIYTNYVNVHISIDKLDGTNYDTWASDIKLWLKSQGYVDHHTHPNVAENYGDQILGSPIVPNFTSTCSTLLRVLGKHTTDITSRVDDSSALVSQHNDRTRPHKSGKGRHKCDHCGKLCHKIDRCYALHGRPPKSVAIAQTALVQPSIVDHTSIDTQANLLFSMKFLNGMRIVRTLVPQLLLHIQVHLLLVSFTLLPLALGF